MLPTLFHLIASVVYAFVFYYDQNYLDIPFPKEYLGYPLKGRFVFLTFWCLALQNLYYPIALINDLIGTNAYQPRKPPLIRKLKDLMFSLLFPVSTYVSAAFWGIYFVDKDMVFPEALEKAMPVWVNHTIHTLIIVTANLEILLFNITYPSKKVGIFVNLVFNVSYAVWIHIIYFNTGIWVYPLFQAFNWPLRIIYVTISLAIGIVLYLTGNGINSQVTKSRKTSKTKSQ